MNEHLFLKAATGQSVKRAPVWLMRQAGRILPEYRAVRSQFSGFKEFVKHVDAITEVTIQPVDILGVDAAIIFSDILVIPEAMGLNYEMEENKGPVFPTIISSKKDIESLLSHSAADHLGYVYEALSTTKKALGGRVPLLGFAGAPWTIFAYMTEGQGSKTFSKAKAWLYQEPELSHLLLQKITDATLTYLQRQFQHGADWVQVFDSWAGVLSPEQYHEFSFKYIKQIVDAMPEAKVTVFAKGAYFARPWFAETAAQVIGLDWSMDVAESRHLVGTAKTLQGNVDPCALYGDLASIEKTVKRLIQSSGNQRFIANLGHGLYPDTDKNKVKFFIDKVKEISSF